MLKFDFSSLEFSCANVAKFVSSCMACTKINLELYLEELLVEGLESPVIQSVDDDGSKSCVGSSSR